MVNIILFNMLLSIQSLHIITSSIIATTSAYYPLVPLNINTISILGITGTLNHGIFLLIALNFIIIVININSLYHVVNRYWLVDAIPCSCVAAH